MKSAIKYLIFLFTISSFFTLSFAQASSEVKYTILPQSIITVDGTSTLHNFTVNAKEIEGYLVVNKTAGDKTPAFGNSAQMNVSIPVKKLDTDKSSMNDNMDDALKADKYPDITFVLKNLNTVSKAAAGDSVELKADGSLSIAGVSKNIELTLYGRQNSDGTLHFSGKKELAMTDYGVKPPTMFFGAIKVGKKVTVNFNLLLAAK